MLNLSIIVVNFNSFDLLKNCLSSLTKYTQEINYEIIVVNNNSEKTNIKKIINKYDNVFLIENKENVGFAAANNQGIKIAKGKYILFLNNDTIFIENTIKKIYDFAETIKEPVFVGCKLLNQDGSIQNSVISFPSVWNTFTESFFLYKLFPKSTIFNKYAFDYMKNEASSVDWIKGAFIFATASAIQNIKGFDERFFFYGEEIDLCYRFRNIGGKVYYLPTTSIIHLGGATTLNNLTFLSKNQIIGKVQYFQKYFKGYNYSLIMIFIYLGILIRIPIYFFAGILSLKMNLITKSKYYLYQLFIYPKNLFK